MREPTLFLSGEKRADIGEALFAAVEEERPLEAAEKLLILAALAGWTQAEFAAADWAAMSGSDQSAVLGRRLEAGEAEILDSLRALCAERGLTVSAFRDDSGQLEHYLAGTPSPQTVLVFTASAADKRKRIVKTVQQCGTVVELTVQRERSGALSAESVDAMIGSALGSTGKRLTPGARQLLVQRAGSQAGVLAGELEKLCLYVGDAATIDEAAVRDSVRDLAESWVFDFTKALAQRQAGAAVAQLRALFAQGEHPLRLLSLIARELRLLLLARDCLRGSLAGTWTQRTTYANVSRPPAARPERGGKDRPRRHPPLRALPVPAERQPHHRRPPAARRARPPGPRHRLQEHPHRPPHPPRSVRTGFLSSVDKG